MKKKIMALTGLVAMIGYQPVFAAYGVFINMVLNFVPNPGACAYFINTGALYMEVNPGLPLTITGGEKIRALVNANSTVAIINGRPGYTVIVPALNEEVFCSAMCALTEDNCWRQCR